MSGPVIMLNLFREKGFKRNRDIKMEIKKSSVFGVFIENLIRYVRRVSGILFAVMLLPVALSIRHKVCELSLLSTKRQSRKKEKTIYYKGMYFFYKKNFLSRTNITRDDLL